MHAREIGSRKVIFVTAADNSLLKKAFGLKSQHLGLKSANSEHLGTETQERLIV
jgi:hypothetical protein